MEFCTREDIEVGDVIRSPHFAFGMVRHDRPGDVYVGIFKRYRSPDTDVQPHIDDRSDMSRSNAEFVVEQVVIRTSGYAPAPTTEVTARRLNSDGTFNPVGEVIFYSMGRFGDDFVDEVELTGRMQMHFTRVACIR
jgi:hypothetical protein